MMKNDISYSAMMTHRHHWANRLQTLLLMLILVGISCLTGSLIFGELGVWLAAATALFALLFEPVAAWRLTLQLYRARPIYPDEAPALCQLVQQLAARAELPFVPVLYYVPSSVINAFAVGNRNRSAIALTDGLLNRLSQRELVGVLGHEIAHIAHDDLKVMGLADFVSRLTSLFSGAGQIMLMVSLPLLFIEGYSVQVNPMAMLLLIFSPHLALLAQLGLSRLREYDADLKSAVLTGDPMALAYALARIEQAQTGWLSILLPGWGNPEPSWLRSHPPTTERIRRLKAYAASHVSQRLTFDSALPLSRIIATYNRAPRWRIGGFWR
ncbi:MAG: zinc metalloprotease HtpX [Gammaproteobacteria bacterium]